MKQIKNIKLSQIFFWLFLISIPFNKRVIYNPEHAYINGYFSYYLAYFLYLSDIFLFLCIISYAVEGEIRFYNQTWFKNPVFWLILAIITSLFHVQHSVWIVYSILKAFELIALGILVTQDLRNLKPKVIAWVLIISSIFQGILGIWQFHVQHSLGFSLLGEYISGLGTGGLATIDTSQGKLIRAYGTFPHPNILAAFLVFGLISSFWIFVSRETNNFIKIGLIIVDYLLILGIFLTFSRVAWLACALSMLILLYILRKSKKWLILAIFSVLVSCATILIFWHNLLLSRVTNIQESNSYTQRVVLNDSGFAIWKTNPIFGVGLGNYIPVMEKLFHVQSWEYQPSHNIFIYILANLGIVGLGLFIWLIVWIFRSTWNAPNSNFRLIFLLLGFVIIFMSMFDHFLVTIQQGQLMFALVLGLMAGLPKLNQLDA